VNRPLSSSISTGWRGGQLDNTMLRQRPTRPLPRAIRRTPTSVHARSMRSARIRWSKFVAARASRPADPAHPSPTWGASMTTAEDAAPSIWRLRSRASSAHSACLSMEYNLAAGSHIETDERPRSGTPDGAQMATQQAGHARLARASCRLRRRLRRDPSSGGIPWSSNPPPPNLACRGVRRRVAHPRPPSHRPRRPHPPGQSTILGRRGGPPRTP
jgi:hypothetical protein